MGKATKEHKIGAVPIIPIIVKEVIIVTQSNEDVPFDIRHRRYIDYSPKALTTLRSRLEKTIKRVVVRVSDNDGNENENA